MNEERTSINGNAHIGDVNSKTIFGNHTLCAQFLRDNINVPGFENLTEEDIEDVTERYTSYFGVEYDADTVKKVHIRLDGEETDIYVISLIDHKSQVDYNVSIQLLKYMACIWAEYEKGFLKYTEKKNITGNKSFRYPPILPIVYYEGADRWTADKHLKDRIMLSDIFAKYIPDYEYIVVRNHDYTNEELLARQDEMSLIMIINKIQKSEDISEYLKLPADEINKIVKESPQELINIIAAVIRSLCERVNATNEEKEECVRKVVGRQMGYLFENMEKMDIQAERRKTQEQIERAEQAEQRADAAKKRLDAAEKRIDAAKKRAGELQSQLTDAEIKLTDTENKLTDAEIKLTDVSMELEVYKLHYQGKTNSDIADMLNISVEKVKMILEE